MKHTPENFVQAMNTLFPKPGNFLEGESDFQFLVAILLSAQMTDRGVNNATHEFFKSVKNPIDAVKIGEKGIYEYVKTVNFAPTKARNIFKTAQLLEKKFSGKVPRTRSELVELFGVGNKTAGVFVVQRGHEYAFPVDTHIARIAIAFGFTNKPKSDADGIESDLQKIFPKETWRLLHKQIILYGRTHLTARNIPTSPQSAWENLEILLGDNIL